jgi:hypothetical protein
MRVKGAGAASWGAILVACVSDVSRPLQEFTPVTPHNSDNNAVSVILGKDNDQFLRSFHFHVEHCSALSFLVPCNSSSLGNGSS